MQTAQKTRIQNEFWEKLRLHVDRPLNGVGNCNTGYVPNFEFATIKIICEITKHFYRNTARKIFENAKISSEILGIEEEIISGLADIWTLINCGLPLEPTMFGNYCQDWINLYKNSSIRDIFDQRYCISSPIFQLTKN